MHPWEDDSTITKEMSVALSKVKVHSQAWWQIRIGYKYTPEWYAWYYATCWLDKTTCAEDLRKDYITDGDNNSAMFTDLTGRGLELGFSNGRTMYFLCQKFPKIIYDGCDWCPSFVKIIPFIKQLCPQAADLWISNCNKLDKPDSYYDWITSLDTYEHVQEEDYLKSVAECYRILKPLGRFFVYFGQPDNASHINRRRDDVVIKEVTERGFVFKGNSPSCRRHRRSCLTFQK